jgi:hypothetical protein
MVHYIPFIYYRSTMFRPKWPSSGTTRKAKSCQDHYMSFSFFLFLCGEGPRSRNYGRTAALRRIVQPCDEDEEKDDHFFSFFQVMEHRWNEIDKGKPKFSG